MALYQLPVRQRARVEVSGYPPDKMRGISDAVAGSVKNRIAGASDVNDAPAPPLAMQKGKYPSYQRRKTKAGKAPVRDWNFTGRTMKAMKTLDAGYNRAVIGFDDVGAGTTRTVTTTFHGSSTSYKGSYVQKLLPPSIIARFNNARNRQFGVSPSNRVDMGRAMKAAGPPVQVVSK